jgi:hypothetical protein
VTPLDQATIDPGVRLLVALLRGHGHETTDSGDGRSKPPEDRDMGETPHVHVRARAQDGYLVDVVAAAIDVGPGVVQLTWDSLAPTAIISVVAAARQAREIVGLLREHGVDVGPGVVQLTWDPLAPTAIISVVGVADEHLRVTGSAELTARAEMGLVEKRVVTEDPR